MSKIFISHSKEDSVFAKKLATDLEEMGYSTWLDEWEIKVGQCIPTGIEKGLTESKYVVVILSKKSVESGWVDREWKIKYWDEIKQNEDLVLPLLLENCEIPVLLKTKKYADFRKNYSVALVELMSSISPMFKNKEQVAPLKNNEIDFEISKLLSKVQSDSECLGSCLTEALSIATKVKNVELQEFCKCELVGWPREVKDPPTYRLKEVFVSLYKINLQHFEFFGGGIAAALQYMENDKNFFPMKMFFSLPVSELENSTKKANIKDSLIAFSGPAIDIFPNTEDNSSVVNIYAKPTIFLDILVHVRSELTKKLLNLLPGIPTEWEQSQI